MAINFTITASGANIVNQADIDVSLSKNLNIENFSDDQNNLASIDDYFFEWYFIDKPEGSACSFDTTITPNNKTIKIDSIDTWGTYRVFCIAKEIANFENRTNDNPLQAEEKSFINIIVKSTNNLLEKPANFQRNWKTQYDNLINVVDNTTKRINNLKVSNSTTFTLPTVDGVSGQVLTTNGSGLLSFATLDLANMETNLSINSLSDVISNNPQDGYALVWNTDHWEPGEIQGSNIDGLSSVTENLTKNLIVEDGYSIIPETGPAIAQITNDIGSFAAPFNTIYTKNIDCAEGFALNEVIYSGIDGAENTFLKTDGDGVTSFSTIALSNISDIPLELNGNDILQPKLDSTLSLGASDKLFNKFYSNIISGNTVFCDNIARRNVNGESIIIGSNLHMIPDDVNKRALEIQVDYASVNQDFDAFNNDIFAITTFDIDSDPATYDDALKPYHLFVDKDGIFNIGNKNAVEPSNYSFPLTRGEPGEVLTLGGFGDPNSDDIGKLLWKSPFIYFSVNTLAASGNGNLSYINDTGTLEYTPPDLSSFIDLTSLSVNQVAASGDGTLSYNNTNGVLTYTPPDLSNLGGGGGGGFNNWTENGSGHIIPNANATYDIGEAENKVRHLYLSDNSLFIGDSSISLSINDSIQTNNSQKEIQFKASSIKLDNYKFSETDTNPSSIQGGITYRIHSVGNVDFKLVGATLNEVGHIFVATEDGSDEGANLVDDGISFVRESEVYNKGRLYFETTTDFMSVPPQNRSKLMYNIGGASKEIVGLSNAPMSIPGETSLLTYADGNYSSMFVSGLEIPKTIHLTGGGINSTESLYNYPTDPVSNTLESSKGPNSFLFKFKNNSGKSMVIKKVTLFCSHMTSNNIEWSLATCTDAELVNNVAHKFGNMATQTMSLANYKTQQEADADNTQAGGTGVSTYVENNFTAVSDDQWLVVLVHNYDDGPDAGDDAFNESNYDFTLSVTYT